MCDFKGRPLLSIIVPVYNNATTLPALMQQLRLVTAVEVIFIDDGSTDGSLDVIRHQLKLFEYGRLIVATHGGAAAARNQGIAVAKGMYIAFVDADDEVDGVVLSDVIKTHLINQQIQIDLVLFVRNGQQHDMSLNEANRFQLMQVMLKLPVLTSYEGVGPEPFNKFYRTQLIRDANLTFNESLHMGEDMLFNVTACQVATDVRFVPAVYYQYMPTAQSATRRLSFDIVANSQCFLEALRPIVPIALSAAKVADTVVMDSRRLCRQPGGWLNMPRLIQMTRQYQSDARSLSWRKRVLFWVLNKL
ncbi:glycosyltransferase [Weissella sp. MSCH1]|uniref:glycosyltransferase n=1 Tax=Weissella sp. MSCH1 TaxID=3383343 RepID=UPI003896CECD